MSERKSGVVTKLAALEHRALYTHCYGHALNLATQDALKGIKTTEETLDTVYEITKHINPNVISSFQNLRMMLHLDHLVYVYYVQHDGQFGQKH